MIRSIEEKVEVCVSKHANPGRHDTQVMPSALVGWRMCFASEGTELANLGNDQRMAAMTGKLLIYNYTGKKCKGSGNPLYVEDWN